MNLPVNILVSVHRFSRRPVRRNAMEGGRAKAAMATARVHRSGLRFFVGIDRRPVPPGGNETANGSVDASSVTLTIL